MLFNSLPYLFFLPLVAIILFVVPKNFQWLWLLTCSMFFYYTLLPYYLILFFALALLNFYLGIAIYNAGARKKSVLVLSVAANIFVLVFFKYFGFFESLFIDITKLSTADNLLKIILPIGLSFYIFTILSYLIELKRGTIVAERHFGVFASSLLFFPKIMQGPIERPNVMFSQFREVKSFDYDRIVEGVKLMLWGYFKKLVVADRLAVYVNAVYGNYEQHSSITLLVATFFFSIQIYADFSGYTDIALGSAKVLGFALTNNFNRPYFATSIKEFWNRWHISFSSWLRDYLFLPLAYFFSRRMKGTKYFGIATEKLVFLFASLITFAVCGIWHGEKFNFLIWGLLFGIYLTIANWMFGFNKVLRSKLHISKQGIFYKSYGILITVLLVSFAWIFFRANTFSDALTIIRKIIAFKGNLFVSSPAILLYSFFGIIFLLLAEFNNEYLNKRYSLFYHKKPYVRLIGYASIIVIILLVGVFDGGQFIYFQF